MNQPIKNWASRTGLSILDFLIYFIEAYTDLIFMHNIPIKLQSID